MNRKIPPLLFQLISFLILVIGCAKVSAPAGGPKDKLPPVVVESIPANRSKNFIEKRLAITFDEFVALDNINDKFMISPPTKKKPLIMVRGKSVIVEFEDQLKENTTYTLYFQDAIKDLNEGNKLENYKFVFSTGPVIDSLSVTGNVYNAFDLEIPEKTTVLMYRDLSDSAVISQLPDYISRVDNTGYFSIDNISRGSYRLYALKDDDNSKNYNFTGEEFAFINNPVIVTPERNYIPEAADTSTVKANVLELPESLKTNAANQSVPIFMKGEYPLYLFKAENKSYYLTSSSRDPKYLLKYTLSLPPADKKFEFSIAFVFKENYFIEKSKNRDTIKVWLTDSTLYSQPMIPSVLTYPFTDSLGLNVYKTDTIQMRYTPPRAPRSGKTIVRPFTYETNIKSGNLKPAEKIVFNSPSPFREPDTSRIRLYEMVDNNRKKVPFRLLKDSVNSCRFLFDAIIAEGKKYLFIADSASFGNIYGENSDSTGIRFAIKERDLYNKISVTVKNAESGYIIQLMGASEKILGERVMKSDGKVEFPLLEPGKYRLRAIYDLNGDGKWTTGDFEKGRQPEPVSYYQQELEIKTGWDIDNEWDMTEKHSKDLKLRKQRTGAN